MPALCAEAGNRRRDEVDYSPALRLGPNLGAGEMRILVVEDERKVANFIRQGLEEEGNKTDIM